MALQRQRIESVIDDWSVMTDDERKQVIQMIFAEIRADHTTDGLKGALNMSHLIRIGSPEGIRTPDLFLERERATGNGLGDQSTNE